MTTPSAGSCAQSWFYFEGSCYGYFRNPVNFKSALKVCRTVKNGTADLVSIHSEAENAFVYNLWLAEELYLGQLLWIGYYQHADSDPFTWIDGTPDNYTSWEPTQPDNNGGNEDCVAFWRQSAADDVDKHWNDVFCGSVTAPFVCKKAP
ncbi:alpha-N-acetylgalactosamine-specific lectin-like [Strongylocentrotus purpuratus]|uniref:C-type lectin domain-containing protein n=1 Tax=Strongylocentrotus purpuratus TaxID=7668 RepID=A0A7M7P3L2_STRPU|nr:alpha-N-acetylgalactosamine-specific lectin-like [Strongylocentrotus purpuratus]